MTGTGEWKPLWERRDSDETEQKVERGASAASFSSRLENIRYRLPVIGAALAVVFIVTGVMRAVFGLFGASVADESSALELCVSQTVGDHVAIDLASNFLQREGARQVTLARNQSNDRFVLTANIAAHLAPATVDISIGDASAAFDLLANHRCHVAVVSREMNPIEASRFGSAPAVNLIGLDGAVVVVHPANPLHTLTLNEIRGIFGGDISDWEGLGEDRRAIHVVMPPKYADETSVFTSRVLAGQVPTAHFQRSADVALVVSGPLATGDVGLTTFHSSDPARFVHIIDGAGREFTPSTLAIGRRTYPLTMPVYAYRDESNMTSAAYRFLSFLNSTEGQNVIVNDGFVSPFTF